MTNNLHRCIDDGGGTGQKFRETELPMVQQSVSSAFLDGKTKQKKKLCCLKTREKNEANTQDKYGRSDSHPKTSI